MIRIPLNIVQRIQPLHRLLDKRLLRRIIAMGRKLGNPNRPRLAARLPHILDVGDELIDIGSIVPMRNQEIDAAVGAAGKELLEVLDAHDVAIVGVVSTVCDGGSSDFDVGARADGPVNPLLVGSDGAADVLHADSTSTVRHVSNLFIYVQAQLMAAQGRSTGMDGVT